MKILINLVFLNYSGNTVRHNLISFLRSVLIVFTVSCFQSSASASTIMVLSFTILPVSSPAFSETPWPAGQQLMQSIHAQSLVFCTREQRSSYSIGFLFLIIICNPCVLLYSITPCQLLSPVLGSALWGKAHVLIGFKLLNRQIFLLNLTCCLPKFSVCILTQHWEL